MQELVKKGSNRIRQCLKDFDRKSRRGGDAGWQCVVLSLCWKGAGNVWPSRRDLYLYPEGAPGAVGTRDGDREGLSVHDRRRKGIDDLIYVGIAAGLYLRLW